ncbi:MAG TPA: FG-GAP-like repeat-containing protein, partial [Burkholderiales bacterium]|nr:FG-GAP-like repeat-containing protein [Burkholderiales bacterium]
IRYVNINLLGGYKAMSVPVFNPTSSPWSSIVLVEVTFPSGASFAGSGVMVSPNDVLTASHVLYMPDQGGAATSVHVLPAGISAPFGDITSNSFHYYTNFDPSGSGMLMPGNGGPGLAGSELDLALIALPTAIGNQTGWMQLDPNFTGGTVNITGLPAASGWMESNDVVSAFKSPTDSIISYSAALNPGDSGAPIWYEASDGGHVAGVVSTTSWGGSVDGVYNDLLNWINSDGGSVIASQPAAGTPAVTTTTTATTPVDTTSSVAATTTTPTPADTTTTTVDVTSTATTTVDATSPSTATTTVDATTTKSDTSNSSGDGDHIAPNLSDFNGDGHSDIVLHNTATGMTEIHTVDGTTPTGAADTSAYGPPVWSLTGTGDLNAGGHGDMLWQAEAGQVAAWTMNGSSALDTSVIAQGPANAHMAGVGDFDGDGRSDVLWRADDGTVSTWQMSDHSVVGGGTVGQQTNDWHVSGTGDFNGDGKADVLWHNDNGSVAMWLMDGTAHTGGATIAAPSTDWHIAGVGDFNGDHNSDIAWQNTGGAVSIWLMNGENPVGGIGTITETIPAGTTLAGVGDFNADHHSDLLWRDASGALRVELMDGLHSIGTGTVATIGSDWAVS